MNYKCLHPWKVCLLFICIIVNEVPLCFTTRPRLLVALGMVSALSAPPGLPLPAAPTSFPRPPPLLAPAPPAL